MALSTFEDGDLEEDWASAKTVGALDADGGLEDWSSASSRSLDEEEKRKIADSIVRSSQQTGMGGALARQDTDYQAATDKLGKKLEETSFLDEVSSFIPFESLQTQGGKELRQLQSAQEAAAKKAGSATPQISKNPLDWATSLTSDPFAVSMEDVGNSLENLDRIKKNDALKSIYNPEEFTNFTRDAAAEDWDSNEKGWHVRSNGEFKFSPQLLTDRTKFADALNGANIPKDRADAALGMFDQKKAEDRSGLIALAKKTPTFQNFAAQPENQGKSDEEVYGRFEKSGNWVDWVKSNVVSMPGQTVQYVSSQLAGAAFAASALSDSSGDETMAKVGRALNDFTKDFTPYDVRYSNVAGQTVSQFVPQIATKVGLDLALRRFGVKGQQAEVVSQAFTALSSGAQIGAENYRTVFEANQERYGTDEAHKMATEAFKKSVPLGVSELLSLDVLLSKAPKGKGWAVVKNLASSLAEVGTEQFQNAMSNTINKGASAAYVEPQTMGLGESLEMAAGTSLVELAVGGVQRRARNIAEQRVKEETEKVRQAAANASSSDSPQTAAALEAIAAKSESEAPGKVEGLANDLLNEMEDEDGDETSTNDAQKQYDEKKSQNFTSIGAGVISQDTPSSQQATTPAPTEQPTQESQDGQTVKSSGSYPEVEGSTPSPATPAAAPTLRGSVIASGVPEEAVDTYISNLQAEGLSDAQIQEIADNTRVLREEASKKNEADAEARRDVARRARAGDPEARAQLERERGINTEPPTPTPAAGAVPPVAETPTPVVEPATPPTDQVSQQQTTPPINEGGDSNELRMRNQEEGQGRTEALAQETPEEAGVEASAPTPPQAEAPAPSVAKIQAKRSENLEDFDNADPETQLSDLPANDAIDLLRKVGSTFDTSPVEGGETFGEYLERTGVSVYDFDTRPTVFNEDEKRYVPQGQDPFEGIKDLAAGRIQLQDVQLPPAANEVQQTTPEEQERNRKAQETEDFYRRNQQTAEQETAGGPSKEVEAQQAKETARRTAEAEVSEAGDKGAVSGKRLPVREISTGRSDESGRPITKVVPGFVNDSNTMAEVLYQNRGVERVYVTSSEIENLDPEDIFVQYDETGQAYVVAARHKKYGVVYADTGLTQDGASLAQLHEPTRLKNSQAQTEGKASKLKAKKAGVSEGEISIPEMTEAFEERIARAGISKEEKEKPESVAKTLQQIYKKAQALASETVKTVTGETVSIGAELADRIGTAATNLYLARLRGVDRKGKFKDASGVVADIKKKVIAKLQKRPGTRAGVSLDQQVGEDGATVGDFIGRNDQPLDSMGYPNAPMDSDTESQGERGLEDLSGAAPEMRQDSNVQAAQPERSGTPTEVAQRLGGLNYEEIARNALAAAEAELTPAELKIWRETLPLISGGKKRKDLTDTRKQVVKKVQNSAKEKMQAMISEANYEVDTDAADSMLSAAESSTQSLDERQSRQERTTRAKYHSGQIIDWNGGPTAKGFDTKRVLSSIAEDTKLPQLVRVVARFLANSNVDFSNVKFELIANYQKELNWAGLYTAGDRASSGRIQINISSLHRGGNVAQTIVHEALHHVAFHKLRPSYNRTGVEREAYRDLVRILTHVRKQLLVPEPGKSLSQTARKSFNNDDDFYGVSNIDELFTETLTNERFAAWLSSQAPIPGMQPKNSGVFRNLYDQIKQFLKNLIGGQNVRPDSLLSQAMDNIFALANDPQDDAKIKSYQEKLKPNAPNLVAASKAAKDSVSAAAIENPLGFEFKTQQAIRGMLDPNKQGAFKGLTASPDGTVPLQNLRAKITKAFSSEEAGIIFPVLESMAKNGRVNVSAAAQALQTIAEAKARVTMLSAVDAETDQTRSGLIHQLDTSYPSWEQNDSDYSDDYIYVALRDELDSIDREKIKEAESATARFKQVNPKPLDEMDDAGDIVVEEPVRRGTPVKHSENRHFPTRKNVIGFGRKYTETLPNGEKATFVFEVQSDWAKNAREEVEDRANALAEQERFVAENPNNEGARVELARLRRQDNAAKVARQNNPDSPLLSVYENLVLKAAIQDALAKGQTKLIITDAETAMMTEMHDKYVAPAAWYVVNGESATYRNSKEEAEKEVDQLRATSIEYGGNPNARLEYREAGRPTQELGMRAAYDSQNGRIHNIMRKLTGDKGRLVDLGKHQNADQEIKDRFTEKNVGSRVFKNQDGTPKTNITGVVYDLSPILENQEKVRALFAAPVNPLVTPSPRVARVDKMVQEEIPSLGKTTVRSGNLNGHPAQASFDDNAEPEITYDPEAIAIEVEGLDDDEARLVIRKLLGHEQAHVAGLLNDYDNPDAQGRRGREKIEAFHDEVLTEEMRQQTADAYVRRLDGMTDEDYATAKADFLSDKVAVAGEFKRMFLERHLTGESYEDSLATLARKTGNKFADLVRAIADYLAGRIRMMQTRFEMTKDPRLAVEIMADRRMLENLNNGTNGMLGDSVAGVLSAAAVNSPEADPVKRHLETAGREKSKYGLFELAPEAKGIIGLVQDLNAQDVLNYFEKHGVDWAKQRKVFSDYTTIDGKKYPPEWYDPKPEEDVKGWKKRIDMRDLRDELDTRTRIEDPETGMFEAQGLSFVKRIYRDLGFDPINSEFTDAPKSPDTRFASRAQRTRMMNTSGGWKAAGGLTQNLMDSKVSELIDQKDAAIRGANFKVSETARKFDRLVKKHKPNAQVLNAALGSTENTLTDTQYDAWQKLQRAAKRETDPVKRQAAMAASDSYRLTQVQANNRQIRADRQAALNKLPKELAATVDVMRGHIDGLSTVLKNKGLVGNNLQITLGANLEVYLNRSYEVFDNPEWTDFILTDQSPESQQIRTNAARVLRAQLVAEEARRIRRDARMNNAPVPTRAQAIAAAQATVTNNDVGILMQDYLRVADNNGLTISGGNNPAKKNTSILKLRGQIPKEIRELWGEYKDPQVNYAKTYMKMASFVATHNFQQDLLNMGLSRATPFLWKDGSSQGVRPTHWVEVVPGLKDTPNPNPLAGVYGPPIIAEAFEDIRKTYKHSLVNDWMTGLTGLAMASKTIYNPPQTYVRNILGNGLIMVSQGYVITDIGRLGFLTRLANSANVAGPSLVGARPERSTAVTDYVERMIKLGVMGDNVKANVIKNLTSVVFDRDPGKAFNGALSKGLTFAKGVNDRLTDAYQAGDDLWKIVAFESERSVFARAFPNATPESIDRMAADRVRDVVPTYSKIPQAVQEVVKRQPYLAPYISWTSEIIRTFTNTYKHGWNDATSNNPVLRASGLKRLASVTTAQGLLGAIAYGVRELSGMDDEDEERLRRFLPDWQVNALLMLTGKKENGKFSFWDLSYLNPYDVLHEPFIAMGREIKAGGDFLGVASKGLSKFIDPWTSEQIFFGALMDAARGVTAEGRPLFEQSDSEFNKNRARISRIVDSLTPGVYNFGKRMYMAATGQMTSSGRAYNLNDEFLGAISGQRPSEVDPLQNFKQRNVSAMNRMLQSADSLATKEYRKGGAPDLSKIRENYVQANDARLASLREIRKDVDALVGLGVPNEKVMQTLAASGVSKQDMEQIAAGKYVRRAPSNDALLNAVGLPEYKARIEAMRGAVESYPEVQTLYPSDQP